MAIPLPVFVCNSHKLDKDQARKMLTERLRTTLARKTAPGARLLWERAWVAHVLIGQA